MALVVGSSTICKPQIGFLHLSGNLKKQSVSEISFPTLSLSISTTSTRYAPSPSFCSTSSESSVECNMPSSTKIFIKGLPLSTTELHLTKVFSMFGEVTQVKLLIDKKTGQSLGFAYIWFVEEDSAQSAAKEMNGKVCMQ
ncbi:RNA-binding (RRM/RBD/RNP motif) family protein [Medicago truncatula]|uniref:RNA-binding (RRM/RBD/RNP motif) family protein n=1 Tax=Medicago truncatula TaxID=3880 RepID=A0A072US75_MEDTR|nr:RNA-binding (RRM/RBD/RNP motif) family protein [Medicago truncatula]